MNTVKDVLDIVKYFQCEIIEDIQSIKRKRHLVNNIIESSKPDIVVGTETWLKPNIHTNEVFPAASLSY
jgi:hypothetical protein